MNYKNLGRTGAKVSPFCLGCMNFGWGTEGDEAVAIMHRALDAGLNFWDTADVYNRGNSETIVGKALEGKRDQVFLATKVHGQMGDLPNDEGNSRLHIIKGCEDSLKRLNVDHIDLYQIHRPQSDMAIDETLRALDDLVRAGKVRYTGTSTFAAYQIVESLWVSEKLGLNRFVCEQPPYNLLDRRIERELLPVCQSYGIGVIPWSPLGGGMLTGKYKRDEAAPEGARYAEGKFRGGQPIFGGDVGCRRRIARFVRRKRRRDGRVFSGVGRGAKRRDESDYRAENDGAIGKRISRRSKSKSPDEDNKRVDELIAPGASVAEYYNADWKASEYR